MKATSADVLADMARILSIAEEVPDDDREGALSHIREIARAAIAASEKQAEAAQDLWDAAREAAAVLMQSSPEGRARALKLLNAALANAEEKQNDAA